MRIVSRLVFIAFFLEVGLLLLLAPWSPLWDRNLFTQMWPALQPFAGNSYVRGAVSGLGLINLGAGVAELAALLGPRSKP